MNRIVALVAAIVMTASCAVGEEVVETTASIMDRKEAGQEFCVLNVLCDDPKTTREQAEAACDPLNFNVSWECREESTQIMSCLNIFGTCSEKGFGQPEIRVGGVCREDMEAETACMNRHYGK